MPYSPLGALPSAGGRRPARLVGDDADAYDDTEAEALGTSGCGCNQGQGQGPLVPTRNEAVAQSHGGTDCQSLSSAWSGRSVALPLPLPPLLYSRLVGQFIPLFGHGLVALHITPPDPLAALGPPEMLLIC